MRKCNIIVVFALTFCVVFDALVDAQLPGDWPPPNEIPSPEPEWLDLVDLSEVTDAPVATSELANCDNDQWCTWQCNGCVGPNDIVNCPETKDWGLTFDDGPSENTPKLLDELDLLDTKVTFFVIGAQVVQFPDILKRAVDSGHEIGLHTWSHPHLTQLTTEQVIAELKWTELAIKAAVGVTPKIMRPPFGDYDDRIRDIAAQLGYKIVLWDLDTQDYLQQDNATFDPTQLSDLFKGWVNLNTTNGHISLNHDLFLPGIIATPESVDNIQAGGFTLKPVAECNGFAPYLESNATVANNNATATDITGNGVSTTDGSVATDLTQSDISAATSIYLVCARLLLLMVLAVCSAMFVL
ncbi:9380_t:CDS:2 [Paraglomus occultum]|uniref:9380_t:CDS:1 n=1 Tax=Paraglomus occultum TaxID=144539 RepID=A0A9N9A5P4_9GLOM|nr:9380_t:CDS:2 [Paraglomus occultum]